MKITNKISKKTTSESKMRELTQEHIQVHYAGRHQLWTDASKTKIEDGSNRVGIGLFSERLEHCSTDRGLEDYHRLNNDNAIATAELQALHTLLEHTILVRAGEADCYGPNPLICTDSLSALQEIESRDPSRLDLVLAVFEVLEDLEVEGIRPTFLWVPSHCNISGNEEADRLAKEGAKMEQIDKNMQLGPRELTTKIRLGILKDANEDWIRSFSESCKLMSKAVPSPYTTKIPIDKKYVKRNRLLVNRPYFYLTQKEECETCHTKKTPEHMLLECPRLVTERKILETRFLQLGVEFSLGNILSPHPPGELISPILQYIRALDSIESI